jgi:hypothetical protein
MKVDDAEMARIVEEEGLEELRPNLGTKPRVYYKNLWRYKKCFIGGSVSVRVGGVVDCLADAKVKLMKNGEQVGETETDGFGEFKIDRLDPDSGTYQVEISSNGYAPQRVSVDLGQSTYLGEIMLQPS